jgi:signal transduction histidine kinase
MKWMKYEPKWIWFDTFIFIIRVVHFISSVYAAMLLPFSPYFWILLPCILLTFLVPQFFYRPNYIRSKQFILTEIGLNLLLNIYLLTLSSEASYFMGIPIIAIGYMTSKKFLLWVLPTLFIITPVIFSFLISISLVLDSLASLAVSFLFGFCFSIFREANFKMNQLLQVIESKNDTLEHYAKQVERMTIIEERNRLSKELHDTIGHSYTASIVAMEAVFHLIDRDPLEAKARLENLIHHSRHDLTSFRKTIHQMTMKELAKPLNILLEEAANSFAVQTLTSITFQSLGNSKQCPEAYKLALLRALQESITNAKKHGNASAIDIKLELNDSEIRLIVKDNGKGVNELNWGFGLKSMFERLSVLHGGVKIDSSQEKGTLVTCWIPLA